MWTTDFLGYGFIWAILCCFGMFVWQYSMLLIVPGWIVILLWTACQEYGIFEGIIMVLFYLFLIFAFICIF